MLSSMESLQGTSARWIKLNATAPRMRKSCPHCRASNIRKQQQSRGMGRAEVIGVGLWLVGKLLDCSGERVRTRKRSGGIPKCP